MATNYVIYLNQTAHIIGGTSASTPLVAAMIALFNDQRLANGKNVMGFINPWLYKLANEAPNIAIRDIVAGDDNRCSARSAKCCLYGFPPAPGFDAVTGLGVFDFVQASNYL